MPENLLRVASCSREKDKNIWEFVLTDQRSIFVNHGRVKTLSPLRGLVGGAGGYALGFLLSKQDDKATVDYSSEIDNVARRAGNVVVSHASVREARFEKGFAVWKSLTLEYVDRGLATRIKALLAAPEAYVQARRPAGLGRLDSQREFIHGLRNDLLKALPLNTMVKDAWK